MYFCLLLGRVDLCTMLFSSVFFCALPGCSRNGNNQSICLKVVWKSWICPGQAIISILFKWCRRPSIETLAQMNVAYLPAFSIYFFSLFICFFFLFCVGNPLFLLTPPKNYFFLPKFYLILFLPPWGENELYIIVIYFSITILGCF